MAPSFALAANPWGGMWRAYNRAMRRRPLLVNMATSAALWATGDILSQHVQYRCATRRPDSPQQQQQHAGNAQLGEHDTAIENGAVRALFTGAFGGLVFGPMGHAWYAWLDCLAAGLGVPGTLPYIVAKVLADNCIFTPLYVGLFMAYSSLLITRSGPTGAMNKLRQDFVPTVVAEGMIWPPIMAVLFACVPLSHQLLAVNAVTVADVALLSWLEEHDVSELASALPFTQTSEAASDGDDA